MGLTDIGPGLGLGTASTRVKHLHFSLSVAGGAATQGGAVARWLERRTGNRGVLGFKPTGSTSLRHFWQFRFKPHFASIFRRRPEKPSVPSIWIPHRG